MAAALAVGGGGLVAQGGTVSADDPFPKPVPQARCGKGSNPETDIQGRVPRADYRSGRAAEGYTCNTKELAHEGGSGGFKVLRYTDEQGNTCAFYDNTLIFPRDVVNNLATGQGTVVLDMSRPRRPVRTTTLDSPAMVSPHETLLVNRKRGLLAAVLGTAATYPGVLDVYDVSQDCRDPQLLSSTLSGVLGHESQPDQPAPVLAEEADVAQAQALVVEQGRHVALGAADRVEQHLAHPDLGIDRARALGRGQVRHEEQDVVEVGLGELRIGDRIGVAGHREAATVVAFAAPLDAAGTAGSPAMSIADGTPPSG